jgi:hypothetical protein
MTIPCQKEHGPYEWGIGDIYWNCKHALNLKCVPSGPYVGDGLDPWKVVNTWTLNLSLVVQWHMYVQNHMQKT